jgi:GLPGLI family protein
MKKMATLLVIMAFSIGVNAQQRIVAECTVTYAVSADEASADKETVESLKSTLKTVYIKANQSRVDLTSPSYSSSIFYDKTNGNAVSLRESGNNKFITKLDNIKWKAANKRFDSAVLANATETKVILGYECKKAELKLKDGNSFTIYYATNIVPSVKEFEYQFKDVPGFVLEYEYKGQEASSKKIKYTATKINLSPVQASKFEVPTSGYRVYDN